MTVLFKLVLNRKVQNPEGANVRLHSLYISKEKSNRKIYLRCNSNLSEHTFHKNYLLDFNKREKVFHKNYFYTSVNTEKFSKK